MRKKDAHELSNLGLGTKLLFTLALLTGFALFVLGWLGSVFAVSWSVSWMTLLGWGARVAALPPEVRQLLLAAHVTSLALVLPLTSRLFERTPLPRLTRRSLFAVATTLAALDVGCWFLVRHSDLAQSLLGSAVLVTLLFIGYLIVAPLRAMWLRRRWPEAPDSPLRVVVVGGGFAGLYAALGLDRALGYHHKLAITVIDRRNYFLFPPLLPSVAVGAIETRQVTYPFRRLFEATNVRFKKETVIAIDPARRVIRSRVDVDEESNSGKLCVRYDETSYDYLVLAPGSTTNTFKTPGVEHAFLMREVSDAMALRNHVIDCFESAARETDPALIAEMLRFVVIGAGPTGVEVASELRDLVDHVLLGRYPEVDAESVEVILIDSGQRVLNGWHEAVAESAGEQLRRLGVKVLHGVRVAGIGADWVALSGGTRLDSRTAVWCAGVAPAELLAQAGLPRHASGRIAVGPDCRALGQERVFVLGDAAFCAGADGKPLPPLGQVAFQQGSATARNLLRLLRGGSTRPFRYLDFGQLVSVGHQFAAVRLLGLRLSGFVAWVVWRTLYLGKLVGFGNKLRVALDWTLDLFIERSISQLQAGRSGLAVELEKVEKPAA
jgi:NADH:ubiquinone reductase (H+-translocating)